MPCGGRWSVLTCERVPGGAVGDAVLEARGAGLAGHAARHLGVVARVHQRQVPEHVVVGRDGRRVRVVLEHYV